MTHPMLARKLKKLKKCRKRARKESELFMKAIREKSQSDCALHLTILLEQMAYANSILQRMTRKNVDVIEWSRCECAHLNPSNIPENGKMIHKAAKIVQSISALVAVPSLLYIASDEFTVPSDSP